MSELPWLTDELVKLEQQGLVRRRRTVLPLPHGRCEIDGQTLLNFATNDYLDLAHDPRVIAAARDALESAGAGSRASALVAGRSPWHARLEESLAAFEGQEAALIFPSGYAANLGAITALADEQDAVCCDRLNHASLIDGCRLCGAKLRVYRHADLNTLERALAKSRGARRRYIVTDGLFSMDADFAPLLELSDLAERFDAALVVDEAHGTGVFGNRGRGVVELLGAEDRVAVRIGTLSKAIGSLGGFVTGPRRLIDWLWNQARPHMFSTALPPAVCAAACQALEIIQTEPERRVSLLDTAHRFRQDLRQAGVDALPNSIGPIVPILVQTPERAVAIAAELQSLGFFVACIRWPTVPANTSRLRITLTTAHSNDDLRRLTAALVQTTASAGTCAWPGRGNFPRIP